MCIPFLYMSVTYYLMRGMAGSASFGSTSTNDMSKQTFIFQPLNLKDILEGAGHGQGLKPFNP